MKRVPSVYARKETGFIMLMRVNGIFIKSVQTEQTDKNWAIRELNVLAY